MRQVKHTAAWIGADLVARRPRCTLLWWNSRWSSEIVDEYSNKRGSYEQCKPIRCCHKNVSSRRVRCANNRTVNDLVGLSLHEIINSSALFAEGYVEAAFDSRRFRGVRLTSMDVFKRLLIPRDLQSGREPELV